MFRKFKEGKYPHISLLAFFYNSTTFILLWQALYKIIPAKETWETGQIDQILGHPMTKKNKSNEKVFYWQRRRNVNSESCRKS